jgi:predicted CopG family antitoxin
MGERLYRTQVLLEPGQHRALAEIARSEGRSVSDVIRELIRAQLEQRATRGQGYLNALERIRKNREEILARRGGTPIDVDVAALINGVREERDEQIARALDNRP